MESKEARIKRLESEKAELLIAIAGLTSVLSAEEEDQREELDRAIQAVEKVTGMTYDDFLQSLD